MLYVLVETKSWQCSQNFRLVDDIDRQEKETHEPFNFFMCSEIQNQSNNFSVTMNLGSPLSRRKTVHALATNRSRDWTETAGIHAEN